MSLGQALLQTDRSSNEHSPDEEDLLEQRRQQALKIAQDCVGTD